MVVSVSWTTPQHVVEAFESVGPHVEVVRRASDWGMGRRARLVALTRSTTVALRAARGAETLVLLTVGYEVFVAALLLRLPGARKRPRLVVADFLMPGSRRLGTLQGWLLRRVDRWACIRTGDIPTLVARFGVDPDRCAFVRFPVSGRPEDFAATVEAAEDDDGSVARLAPTSGYVYAAGSAHRDWTCVLDALEAVGCPAVLAVEPTHPQLRGRTIPPNVTVLGRVPPERGRQLAADADVVVVALRDTPLPAGPLVLVDALALGKAVVATDANGTRDYVVDGETALTVPAGDPEALAKALLRLLEDADLRDRLGAAGRAWVEENLQAEGFARAVLS